MSKTTKTDSYEAHQQELDPHRREELKRAMRETAARLRARGVLLTGQESSEELVAQLEAVERFEKAVESRGGDLFVDEGPGGVTREPDWRRRREPCSSIHQSMAECPGDCLAWAAVRRSNAATSVSNGLEADPPALEEPS